MNEETKKTEETKPVIVTTPAATTTFQELDFTKALEHLNTVEQEMKSKFAGKKGVNPFLWIGKYIHPLRISYENGDRTSQLRDRMLKIKVEEPKI